MCDERTQITSLKDVFILVPRATRLNLEPTNKRRALGTRMGRLRGGYLFANLWNPLEQCGWSTTHKSCLCDSLTSSRFYSLSINVWNSGYVRDISQGVGVLPHISYIGMCHSIGKDFCSVLAWKHFPHLGLESGMVFEGTTGKYERIYRFNSEWVRKKEKFANSKGIRWIFLFAL